MNKRMTVGVVLLSLGAIIGGVFFVSNSRQNSTESNVGGSQIFVGGDIHTLTTVGNRIFVTGHEGAGVSTDGGKSWAAIPSLNNSDIMGWSQTGSTFLVGGHPGLMRSTDGGITFSKVAPYKDVTDIHSMGAAGDFIYLGSPQIGLLASSDGGKNWNLRNSQMGQGFMGSMLVDPTNPKRIIAPDMSAGLVTSNDAGVTWRSLGGPSRAMSVSWNPININEIAAIGMMGSAISKDGGETWTQLTLPEGSSAVAFSADGAKLYVATLIGDKAQLYSSSDNGKTWMANASEDSKTTKSSIHSNSDGMDPDMPGMNHVDATTQTRPTSVVLGTFGFGVSTVFIWAATLRRKDRRNAESKKIGRTSTGLNR